MKLFTASMEQQPSAACSYVATQRGGVALLFEGHRYNKVRDGKDGTVYWRCSRDRQCPGRAVTVNNRVKKSNNKHNHLPEASLLLRNGGSSAGGAAAAAAAGNHHHHFSANNNNNNSSSNNNNHSSGSNSSASSAMAAAAAAAAAYASFLQGGNASSGIKSEGGGHHHHRHHQQQQHSPLLSSRVVHGGSPTTTTTTSSSPSPLSALGPLGLGPLTVPGGSAFSSAFSFLHNLAAAAGAAAAGGDTSSLDSPTSSGKTTSAISPPPPAPPPLSLTSPPTSNHHQHSPHSQYHQQHHYSQQQHHQSSNNNHSHNHHHANNLSNSKSQYRNSSFSSSSATLDLSPSRSPFAFSGNDHHHHHHHHQQHYLSRHPSSSSSSPSTSNAQRMHKSGRGGSSGYLKSSPPSSPIHHQLTPASLAALAASAPPPPPPSSSSQLEQFEQQHQQTTNLAAALMLQDALQEAQAAQLLFPSLLSETLKYLAAAAATNPQMAAAMAANLTAANPALLKSLDLAAAIAAAGGGGGGGVGGDVNIINNINGFGTSLRIVPDLDNAQQQQLNLIHRSFDPRPDAAAADCQPLNMALNDLRGGGCSILKMLRTLMRSGGAAATSAAAASTHLPPSSAAAADDAALLHALVVPTADAHGSEYIAPCDARREFLTKFTGSAGTAVVTLKEAALWTDGRYFLQAAAEMDPQSWVLMKDRLPGTATIGEWLNEVLAGQGGGARVGADPYTMSYEGWLRLERELADGGNVLVGTAVNLVDAVWAERRPPRPAEPVLPLDIAFTGRRWQEKVEEMRQEMAKKKASLLVLTALDDVAWLLNLRGADIAYNPVFFAYAIVTQEKTLLFIDSNKLTASALAHLQQPTDDPMDSLSSNSNSNRSTPNGGATVEGNGSGSGGKSPSSAANSSSSELLEIRPYELVADYIRSYLAHNSTSGRVWMSSKASYALVNLIPESRRLLTGVSPVTSRKAIKNEVELAGMRRAHIKDAVALCEFYAWLEDEVLHHGKRMGARKMSGGGSREAGALSPSSNSSSSSSMSSGAPAVVDEMAVDAKLEEFRRQQDDYVGPSFPAISGSGPNGAIIHYESSPKTNRPITADEMYLLDTGAQFRDGTTDITRTIHLGTPTAHERDCFTRVLKGHISLATARFPRLIKGEFLDSFARRALWDVGLDYNHGTGHGVGSYLNVHEGPSGISNRVNADDPGVQEAMIYSNEPGYYEAGHFGIRLESLVVTKRLDLKYNFNDRGYLGFETITLVPIQTKLIDPSLMTAKEIEWIDTYHQQCRELVGKELELQGRSRALQWLLKETEPIGQ